MMMKDHSYKILIADDSELSFKAIESTLITASPKVQVYHALDGEQACEMADEVLPDLILMDVIMPELNGIEAIKNLKANSNTSDIPVIVLSATESLDAAYEVGANDFILKPFKRNELLIKIRSALDLLHKIQKIQSQNEELEQKHFEVLEHRDTILIHQKDIIDDINYAKRIQKAILPTEESLLEAFPEHFIMDLPCSIVSGDFYWLAQQNGSKYIAVADCTGHGVSGAFLTMAGIAFLNQIMSQKNVIETNDILIQLRQLVMKLLKQKGEEGEANVGMDISIIRLDEETNTLQFSGANNPVYVVRNGELNTLKGDRMPIGIHLNFDKPFVEQKLQLEPGDMIYLFSDGYADQFGGPRNKKFRYRQFQELLLKHHKLPLSEQKEKLFRTMVDWKGNNFQVDDILVVGIKV